MAEYSYDRKYFDRLISRNKFQIWARSFFFPPLQPLLKGNVLDLGCGIGELANFVEKKSQYFGVDINPFCIDYIRKKGLWGEYGSVYKIPLGSETMDVIMLSHVLEHLESPDNALEEISRVLRPSGKLIVIVPMYNGYTKDSTHRFFYGPKQLKEVAQKHDFLIEKFSIFPIAWELLGDFLYFFEYRMVVRKN